MTQVGNVQLACAMSAPFAMLGLRRGYARAILGLCSSYAGVILGLCVRHAGATLALRGGAVQHSLHDPVHLRGGGDDSITDRLSSTRLISGYESEGNDDVIKNPKRIPRRAATRHPHRTSEWPWERVGCRLYK